MFYDIAILFFVWSFLAWMAETAVATIKVKDFRNRGFASGPFCFIYGFTGVLLTIFLQELKDDFMFLFFGSMVVATAVEWFTGKLLERMKRKNGGTILERDIILMDTYACSIPFFGEHLVSWVFDMEMESY